MLNIFVKWLFILLLITDLIYLNLRSIKFQPNSSSPPVNTVSLQCPQSCLTQLNQTITALPTPVCSCSLPTPIKQNIAKPNKTKSTVYIPIPGNGSSQNNNWTDLPGTDFYLNTLDYPNLKEAYFEANIKLLNGNGTGFIRLVDTSVGIEVWGSEVQTNSQKFTPVVSGKLTLRSGNHLYRVQAKSLTADTAVFNSGRLKIIFEN